MSAVERLRVLATAQRAELVRMADEDPLIQARVTASGETGVRLYGEVQKEVIATTLADAYGIATLESSTVLKRNLRVIPIVPRRDD